MKIIVVNSFLILLYLGLSQAACAADAVRTGIFNNKAIEGYDTVAYFTENKPVKGDKVFKYRWRDADWYFSSIENKNLFIASPEKYAPQYGGYCAYAVGHGQLAKIDPRAFSIVENKLYLNYNKKIMASWLEDKNKLIEKGNQYYPGLVDLP